MNTEKLTLKQKRFCEEYVKSGNITESAIKAGYSEKSAHSIGTENLQKPVIRGYIRELTKPDEKNRIASGQEVMQFFTNVMRGEVKDDKGNSVIIPFYERTKAATELAKRIIDTKSYGNKTKENSKDPLSAALEKIAEEINNE